MGKSGPPTVGEALGLGPLAPDLLTRSLEGPADLDVRLIRTPSPYALVMRSEAALPEALVVADPVGRFLERRAVNPGGAELSRAASRDQAGAL